MSIFKIKKENDDNYEVEAFNNTDSYHFILSKKLYQTNHPNQILPDFYFYKNLELKEGDVFYINNEHGMFGYDLNKKQIFLSDKKHIDFDNFMGKDNINFFNYVDKSIAMDLAYKQIKKHNIFMLQMSSDIMKEIFFLTEKKSEPDEAIVLYYEDDNYKIRPLIIGSKGISTYIDEDLELSLDKGGEVGLYHCKDIKYTPIRSNYESFYNDDVDIEFSKIPVTMEEVERILNISRKDIQKIIFENYPYHFDGDIFDNLKQFSINGIKI